jgi:hypothetical protein
MVVTTQAGSSHPTLRGFAPICICLLAVGLAACSEPVDLKQAVEVTDLSSGWFDAGVVNGQNKLVPSVTFKLRKKGDVDMSAIALNMVFKRQGEDGSYDDVFLQRVAFGGAETAPITVRATNGYTADPPQTRAEMLKHSMFRDVTVQIFGKQSSSQWVELQRVDVQRQVLTQ